MSWQCVEWAYSLEKLSGSEKAILANLAHRCDSVARCWPSLDRIAEDTGLTRRTVQAVLKELEKREIIAIQPRRMMTSRYYLHMPSVNKEDLEQAPGEEREAEMASGELPVGVQLTAQDDEKGVQLTTPKPGGRVQSATGGVQLTTKKRSQLHPNSKEYTKNSNSDSSRDERFEEFWAAYPARRTENGAMRKIGKDAASKLYPGALKEISHEDIMVAVGLLTKTTLVEYIPDPERWLKHKRWLDELLPGLSSAEITQGHVNGRGFKIAASAPPEAWQPLAEKMSAAEDGSMHPEVNGSFLDRFALDICEITGLDPNEPRGDWNVLVEWARAGLCDEKGQPWKEYLLPELRRICAKPGYKTPGGLAYFTPALKANWL
jgi:DNA-binding transcriptional ArsR family regulator